MVTDRPMTEELSGAIAVVRDEAWIDSYEEQATAALIAKATRYASSRAAQIVQVGGTGDDDYVEDVVQSAFTDTYLGTLAWDPRRSSLEAHVILAIKSRTRHDREQAVKQRKRGMRHVSFDLHHNTATRGDVEASLAREAEHDHDVHATAERALATLRAIATDERADDVLILLDAYRTGAYSKPEVLAATTLTAKRYRNARARLATFTKRLPAEAERVYA